MGLLIILFNKLTNWIKEVIFINSTFKSPFVSLFICFLKKSKYTLIDPRIPTILASNQFNRFHFLHSFN